MSLALNNCALKSSFFFLSFFFAGKIRIDTLCEPSARQMVHMKYQAVFYLKKKIFQNVLYSSFERK